MPDDLTNLLSCMEEYFKAGGSEGFTKTLPILDKVKDEKTTGMHFLKPLSLPS